MKARLAFCLGLLIAGLATDVVAAPAPKSSAPAKPQPSATARTLQDIHIEGEIAVPQVLFITARDQRRFMDFQHRRYLRTSRQVGETTVLPTSIVLIHDTKADARKETAR